MAIARTACAVAFSAVLGAGGLWALPGARANGWEHRAIPFEAVVKALSAPSDSLRATAARSMGLRGSKRGVVPLLERLKAGETSPQVVMAIFTALGRLRDDRASNRLSRCLNSNPRDEIRAACATALGRIGSKLAFGPIAQRARSDKSILVRSAAVDALGDFHFAASVSLLAKIALGGKDPGIAGRAIIALGQTRMASAESPLLVLLQRPSPPGRKIRILRALGKTGAKSAVRALEAIAGKEKNDRIRIEASVALAAIHDGSSGPALVKMLSDRHPAVQYMALDGLQKIRYGAAIGPVSQLSLGISQRISGLDADGLARDFARVLAALSVQVEALRTISELDAPAGLEALLSAASARTSPLPRTSIGFKIAEGLYETRRMALYGLGYTKSRRALDLLAGTSGIGDDDARLRAVAVRSIGVLGFGGSPAVIKPLLADRDRDVRIMAVRVLGLLKARKYAPQISVLAGDKMSGVRRQAALSLGYLKAVQARAVLEKLAQDDPVKAVRAAAKYALGLL